MPCPAVPLRAEHPSLAAYLARVLSDEQRARPLLISFSQWDFTTGAIAEAAATLHTMGSAPLLALWAGRTPVKDVGWTTMPALARALNSPSRDQRLERALGTFGLPRSAFASPPLRRWRPAGDIRIPTVLSRSSIRAMRYCGSPMGSAILQVTPNQQTPVTDEYVWPKAWVEAAARSYAWAYDQTLALMQAEGSTAAVVYNGRFLHDRAAAAAADSLGRPVLAYDIGGNDTDFELTSDAMHDWSALQQRMLRMYEEWPKEQRDELGSSWFLERANHADPRNRLYVESQEVGKALERREGGRLVVFFSSSGDEISELDLDWAEYFHGQPQALMALAEACRARPDYTFVVRSHPHKRMKPARDVQDWLEAVAAAQPDIHLDPWSSIDSYALMRQADIVVTYGSTTGVEAGFARKPVIVMGPSAYDELGCATRVRTAEELGAALNAQEIGTWEGAVAYGLMMRRRGFTYRYVRREGDGLSLAGQDLDEPLKVVRDLSHLRGRWQKWRLTRGSR